MQRIKKSNWLLQLHLGNEKASFISSLLFILVQPQRHKENKENRTLCCFVSLWFNKLKVYNFRQKYGFPVTFYKVPIQSKSKFGLKNSTKSGKISNKTNRISKNDVGFGAVIGFSAGRKNK